MNKELLKNIFIFSAMGFLLIAITLQFIYIHTQLQVTRNLILKKGLDAEAKASEIGHKQNMFRIYPITVDLNMGRMIREESSKSTFKTALNDIMDQYTYVLPYVCDRSVQQIQIKFNKIGILVLDKNYGSDGLYEDVKNNRVEYIILRHQLYGITVHENINEAIKQQFEKMHEEGKDGETSSTTDFAQVLERLQHRHVFTLLPLLNHDIKQTANELPSNCKFKLFPFLGMVTKKMGNDFLININIEIAPQEIQSNIMMHVIGYRTVN